MRRAIIIDVDGTICDIRSPGQQYSDVLPRPGVVAKLHEYRRLGYTITLFTARNMQTHEGNVGLINVQTLPILLEWLKKHGVPFDEVLVGKPWPGQDGFYVDDRTLRPDEFLALRPADVKAYLANG